MVRAIFRYAMLLAILLAVGLVVFVAVTYPRFQADTQSNRERLLSGSDVLTTEEFRDIEYAVQGEGLLVLLAHGAGGGYDQGLLIGNNYVGESHLMGWSCGDNRTARGRCGGGSTRRNCFL